MNVIDQGDIKITYFDIETLPSQSEDLRNEFAANVTHPGNIKKPESIAKWMEENADAKVDDMMDKTSFDPTYGSIACIGWSQGGETFTAGVKDNTEKQVIETFFSHLPKSNSCLVGHNIVGFDIPFITKRAIILGVKLPSSWVWPRDPKKWGGKSYFDTMYSWDANKMISQDNLAKALGIKGKSDMDGSMVAETWFSGDEQKVMDYCADDVRTVKEIHQRFLEAGY